MKAKRVLHYQQSKRRQFHMQERRNDGNAVVVGKLVNVLVSVLPRPSRA